MKTRQPKNFQILVLDRTNQNKPLNYKVTELKDNRFLADNKRRPMTPKEFDFVKEIAYLLAIDLKDIVSCYNANKMFYINLTSGTVLKFNEKSPSPKFKGNWEERQSQYGKGLTIIRADQCPYTVKNVNEISESAEKEFNIKPKVVTLQNHREAQNSPCPFGTFCILYDGKLIAEHPISRTRFKNIMNKILK